MRLTLLWPGRTRAGHIAEGVEEYLKRLGPYARVEVIEVREERGSDAARAVALEGERLMKRLGAGGYALLDERGSEMTSVEFARYVGGQAGGVRFVVGGAHGVSDGLRAGAALTLSVSRMTLTHEMARLVLVEQLYRAAMINAGRSEYHH